VIVTNRGWSVVSLGELVREAQSGFASGERAANGVVQLRMNNVTTDGTLDWGNVLRVPTSQQEIKKYRLEIGDVLFNSTNSPELVGKTALFKGYPEPVVFSNHFVRLRVDEAQSDPRYLAYWLVAQRNQGVFQGLCTQWVNQAAVRKEDLLLLQIPLPPLPEQQRIAGILARADRLRRLRRYALELSDGYLQAVFVEMFGDPVRNPKGWRIAELGDIGEVQGGLQLSSRRAELALQAPYLRVANAYRDRLDLSEIKMIGLTPDELERLTLQPGDLLLVEGHGNIDEIGRCAIWDGSVPGCVHQNHLIRVRIKQSLASSVYVSRYLNGDAGRSYFRDTSNTTSGLNTISTGIVKRCPVLLPPRSQQKRFACVVQEHERLRAQQREALRQAEQLFGALLGRAFRGEL
jgi:type I restriction enzyme, S subunit